MLLCLCACNNGEASVSGNEKYIDYCDLLSEHSEFIERSEYFDISTDITPIEDGYRFYVIIDNPKVAMYAVEVIAVEDGVDYTKTMAANIGIFEDTAYTLIPNQANVEQGFVKGISISGISENPNPQLKLLIEWSNKDLSFTHREFILVNIDNGEIYE